MHVPPEVAPSPERVAVRALGLLFLPRPAAEGVFIGRGTA